MKISFNYINYFRPNVFVKSISDINVTTLKRSGIKYVFCDLDNTLVPHFTALPSKETIKFAKEIRDNGIKFIIVSNNSKKRVEKFCERIDVDDFIYLANKPFIYKIKKMLKKHSIASKDVLMIGDQFIIDILMANRMGFKSILVLPFVDSIRHNFNNIIISLLEKWIYRYIAHSNILESNDDDLIKETYDYI